MESKDKILPCLNILKRLPPTQIQKNAIALASLIPDHAEELYQKIDKPLDIGVDDKGNNFIQSEFNRDGDSFRSQITNQYTPQIDDAVYPSQTLRKLEVKANAVFDEYYEGGLSACYFWDKDDGGFNTAWLIRKNVEKQKGLEDGSWSSINVIDVKTDGKTKWTYKITTSVVLEMNIMTNADVGKFNITGTLTKQKEESFEVPANEKDLDLFHIMKIGSLVEDVEGFLRSQLDGIYVGKTKDVILSNYIDCVPNQISRRRKIISGIEIGIGWRIQIEVCLMVLNKMNFIKNNIKPFVITSTLFGLSGYSYLYRKAHTNKKELQMKKDNEVEFKDNTRPQNQYFGLSYGFRADQIVLDRLDSGDFIFMKFECVECISVSDIVKCSYAQFTKPYPHYDSLGIVFRDNKNVYVLYDRFGDIVIKDYAEFLQNPFWNEITIRKIITQDEIHKNLKPLFYDENFKTEFENTTYIKRILQQTGLVDIQYQDILDQVFIEDLDVDEFNLFKKGVALGPKINVRTKRNKDLDVK